MEKIIINIDKQMKKELQIHAIQQNTNMTSIIISLIKDYLEKNK